MDSGNFHSVSGATSDHRHVFMPLHIPTCVQSNNYASGSGSSCYINFSSSSVIPLRHCEPNGNPYFTTGNTSSSVDFKNGAPYTSTFVNQWEDRIIKRRLNETTSTTAEIVRAQMESLLHVLKSEKYINLVKKLTEKRRRKRLSRRRKKKFSHEKAIRIDSWRQELYHLEKEEREKDALTKEADLVLNEVKNKQKETLCMRQILLSLDTLRETRLKKSTKKIVSIKETDKFHDSIDELDKTLQEQMTHYENEEQMLESMIEEGQKKHWFSSKVNDKCSSEEIHAIFFGENYKNADSSTFSTDLSLDALLKRRQDWDSLLCSNPNDLLASSISLGWIVPPSSPKGEWNNYKINH